MNVANLATISSLRHFSLTVDSCVNYINIDLYSEKANVKHTKKKLFLLFLLFFFSFLITVMSVTFMIA